MLRKIQSAFMVVGFGIVSYLEFTEGSYFMGSLAAFIVFLEALTLSGILSGNGETTINIKIGRGENK
ncbi:hypothetical protein [Bacillus thuringiensis]|uniref:hypothetical protein n=1 Tax=Bacillus thuringiensis TaxID=1428 RepID=UPI000BFC5599|nr:hypothetical protein [Bacillus thuringiensis]PGM50845.1 hypothetical protein CN949_16270 [Bacillus thuringiensis]